MFFFFVRLSLPAGLLLATAAAAAQPTQGAREYDVSTAPGGLTYVSVFEGYRNWQELSLSPWVDVNRHVREIGGWRSYAKQAQMPDSGPQGAEVPRAGHAHGHDAGAPP